MSSNLLAIQESFEWSLCLVRVEGDTSFAPTARYMATIEWQTLVLLDAQLPRTTKLPTMQKVKTIGSHKFGRYTS